MNLNYEKFIENICKIHNLSSSEICFISFINESNFQNAKYNEGDLYFTLEKFYDRYFSTGWHVAYLDIPKESDILMETQTKFKTNKFTVREIMSLDLSIKSNYNKIKNHKKYYEIIKIALLRKIENLQYIDYNDKKIYEICCQILLSNGLALQYIKKQNDEFCMLATSHTGIALQYVKNQTDEICINAVSQDGCAIKYVEYYNQYTKRKKEMTDETEGEKKNTRKIKNIMEIAVRQNGRALEYINSDDQTFELCKTAFDNDITSIIFVSKLEKKYYQYAINKNYTCIEYISSKKITDEICKYSFRESPYTVLYFKPLPNELYEYAITQHKEAYQLIITMLNGIIESSKRQNDIKNIGYFEDKIKRLKIFYEKNIL
jgi:hypothetical protein